MPIYDRLADVEEEHAGAIHELVELLIANVQGPVDRQIELVMQLDEYVPVLILPVATHAFSVCTIANYQAEGVAFQVMAGPTNAFGPLVFVPQPHAAQVVQLGKHNLMLFISGSYVWQKT